MMIHFNLVPYTDFQTKNLDWIIEKLAELNNAVEEFGEIVDTRILPEVTGEDTGATVRVDSEGEWALSDEAALPDVSGSDNGKYLRVVSGEWETAASDLPEVDGTDNGKILKVVGGVWVKGDNVNGLPTVTTSDAGKLLQVNESGTWAVVDLDANNTLY